MRSFSAVNHVHSSDASWSGRTVLSVLLSAQEGKCDTQNVSTQAQKQVCLSLAFTPIQMPQATSQHDSSWPSPGASSTRQHSSFSLQLILDRAQIPEVLRGSCCPTGPP